MERSLPSVLVQSGKAEKGLTMHRSINLLRQNA